MNPIKIVLADDHLVVRQGLRSLLESEEGLRVVGEAADGIEALSLVEKLHPDVLVMDLMMPNLNGLEATMQLSKRGLKTRIVILSMHSDDAYVIRALRNGAIGYVLKDSSAEDLVRAVREAVLGNRYLSSALSRRMLETFINNSDSDELDPYHILTDREREILQMVAEGASNAAIGDKLSISPRTVETHRANMMRKLDLHTQAEVIRYAIKHGILSIDQ